MLLLMLISLLCGDYCQSSRNDPPLASYRVGVFEHAVISAGRDIASREMALRAMQKNIDVYNETIITARLKGVKMLVFPEYGIYGEHMSRKRMSLCAEIIPDPHTHRNPCKDPDFKGQSTKVQRMFSCIARDNDMFLVINMAGREICKGKAGCPHDGQYLYNTNIVFSPKGEIVARYYKTHLFGENWFNPAKPQAAIFDTPFGKFATFICFDVMFKNPTIELIEKYNIRNIAFPTAWVKRAPLFRSIQMHSAFARGVNVNFLSANLHSAPDKAYGSGIYTPNGAAAFYYRPNVPRSKLVVANIQQINSVKPEKPIETRFNHSKEISIGDEVSGEMEGGVSFKFKHLKTKSGTVKVCDKSFCCQTSYAIKGQFQETYGLGVYSGYMDAAGNKLYLQACTLLNCPSSKCATEITSVKTVFSYISLQGAGFSSKYVYPSVLAMDGDHYKLVPNAWTWDSSRKEIQIQPGKTVNLYAANLVGRDYSKDVPI